MRRGGTYLRETADAEPVRQGGTEQDKRGDRARAADRKALSGRKEPAVMSPEKSEMHRSGGVATDAGEGDPSPPSRPGKRKTKES